jgi:hypothetical protein
MVASRQVISGSKIEFPFTYTHFGKWYCKKEIKMGEWGEDGIFYAGILYLGIKQRGGKANTR